MKVAGLVFATLLLASCATAGERRPYDCDPYLCPDAAQCVAEARRVLRERGEVSQAACYFLKGTEHDPQSFEARLGLGISLAMTGFTDRGTPYLNAVRDSAPDVHLQNVAIFWLSRMKHPLKVALYYRYGTTCLHQIEGVQKKSDLSSEDAVDWLRVHLRPVKPVKVVGRIRSIADVSWRTNAREQGAEYAIIGTSICEAVEAPKKWPTSVTVRYEIFDVASGTKLATHEAHADGREDGGLWQMIGLFRDAANDALNPIVASLLAREELW